MGSDAPALIACSHGTASPAGQAAVAALVAAVAAARPDLEVHEAFVDVQQPDPAQVLGTLSPDRQARLVPLLLSAGYHVFVDLSDIAADRAGTDVTGALGPDPRLVALLHRRLVAAGLRDGDRVVLAAAGSSDARAVTDCAAMAESLAGLVGSPVTPAFLSAAEPRLADAVAAQRDSAYAVQDGQSVTPPRVVVATYLLAPGYFADVAAASGADVVTPPLLLPGEPPPPELVDIVIERHLG
ncbi:sirohydrochlorin ferrochelatase [Humibacillus xanthopallidus]|uniref:Sirohydrochlorin ferrochelatase n=1 Tax=Humibacillus xanthopallidus TaxID=412689 RepID=A0A543PY34_9MICO|nr:CbiX/SirB N-terminal domain-containing protein [Humibacillus xanthopallidus]TQN48982.1 sirohydrochlorin ferrochelatase [Humibacillus xanthopallidus]